MLKLFNLDDSNNPGIVKVKILTKNKKMPVCRVEVVEIIEPSKLRKSKIGSKYTVANKLLRDVK